MPSTYSMEIRCSILGIHVINFSKVGCFRNVQQNCALLAGLKSLHVSSGSIEKEKLSSQFTNYVFINTADWEKGLVLALCCSL